jgi:dehydrogenase/reductase SDR family member 12
VLEYTTPYQLTPGIRIGQEGADGVDLTDKVVVVTGANSGVGKMVSTYCVAKGAKLYMICRDQTRAEKARDDIIAETQTITPDNIKIILADVGELQQVRKAVIEIQQSESSIDALVCNAGVLLKDKQLTSDNNEVTFACHLLGGTYLLTSLLLPQLQKSKEGRVVVVTSGGMYNTPLPSWDVMTSTSTTIKYDGTLVYAYAKRGQVIVAEQWAKDYPDVTFALAHPGWAETPAVDEAFGDMKKYLEPLREPWQGAEGITWLVSAPKDHIISGGLYLDRKIQKKHIAGPFMSEGSYTKNTPTEITKFLENLKQTAGIQ